MTGTGDNPAAALGTPTPTPRTPSYEVVVTGSTITIADDYKGLVECDVRCVDAVVTNAIGGITPARAVRLAQQLVMAAVPLLDPADVSASERAFVASVLWASTRPVPQARAARAAGAAATARTARPPGARSISPRVNRSLPF